MEKRNVPKLRFKGFEDEWKEYRLSDFSQKIIEKNKEFKVKNVISNSAKNGLIEQKEFFDKDIANKNNLDGYYIIKEGDFVYNPRKSNEAPYGPINMYKIKRVGVVSPLYFCFRVSDNVNNNYLDEYFKSDKWYKYIYMNSDQGARYDRVSIKDSEIMKMNIKVPVIEEQTKIANFLSNVDNIIEEQEGKVKDLEQYKKGMMQKIFKQEVRFKDDNGIDYSAWEEKKLGEITDIGTGSNDLQDKDNNGLYPFFVRSKNIERINQYTFDGEAILIPGDGNIGQIYHYINGKFAYHQRVYKISDFKKGVLGKYIYFYMSKFFLKEALKNSVKATVDSLRLPTLTGMLIKLPCLEEQRKIANFLSNIDNIIEEEKNKLEDLKLWKKGLLQQMFV